MKYDRVNNKEHLEDDSKGRGVRSGRVYLGQVSDVVGVEQQLLERAGVPEDVLGHVGQRTVSLVHVLDLPVASLEQGHALEHGS